MDKVLILLITIGMLLLVGAFVGLAVFLLWPIAIPAFFPGLVESGVLAGKVGFFQSIAMCWICSILIKSSRSNNNK